MAHRPLQTSPQGYARAAGALYVVLFVCAPFTMLYLPATLVVPGDAAATANNVAASEALVRTGLVVDSVIFLVEMVLPALFYVLLRPVGQVLALVAAFARLAMACVMGVNLLFLVAPLLLMTGSGYAAVLAPAQTHGLVLLFLDVHRYGVLTGQVFFAFHLFFLGYLLYRSGYVPRLLGLLLAVGSFGYLIEAYTYFLAPGWEAITYPGLAVAAIAELWLMLWLLVKGVRTPPAMAPAA